MTLPNSKATIVFFCLSPLFAWGSFNTVAYFNQRATHSYREPYRGIERHGDNLEQEIIKSIRSATRSLDIAVQELSLPNIAKALVESHLKGVRVRLILENEYSRPLSELSEDEVASLDVYKKNKYDEFVRLVDQNKDGVLSPEEITERDTLFILRSHKIPWIDDTSDGSLGSGLMHHKFVIIDGEQLVVSTANFSHSDIHGDFRSTRTRGNSNTLLHIQNQTLAQAFIEEFEILWGKKFGLKKPYRGPRKIIVEGTQIQFQFSPVSKTKGFAASVNGLIERELQTTHSSADLALFVFSEQRLVDALQRRSLRNVAVRALIDRDFAYRYYSELLDLLGLQMRDAKCRYETGNNPWEDPVLSAGIPLIEEGDKYHYKVAILDKNKIIIGSHNWSAAANHVNDEALLIIESGELAQPFLEQFQREFDRSILGTPNWLLKKIEKIEIDCGQR